MNNQQQKTSPTDVYTIVTNRIIEHLEKGVIPWRKPWADAGLPKNLITGKEYKGINVWLLASLNYPQNYFMTFKQVKDLGGSVKAGEKSQEVIFWKWIEKEKESKNNETNLNKSDKNKTEKIPLLKYYRVFNIDQCEGIPPQKIPPVFVRENSPIESCEKIVNEMPKQPEIRHKEQQAYYHKLHDYVNMPKLETFESSESYYGALFHELVHSTGHTERLNRKELINSKGQKTQDYAVEELTAEMGASYLKNYAGIPIEQLTNNVAYIQGWLERLRKDKKFIVYASSHAQKSVDYILNVRNEEKELSLNEQPIIQDKTTERETELREKREAKNEKVLKIEK